MFVGAVICSGFYLVANPLMRWYERREFVDPSVGPRAQALPGSRIMLYVSLKRASDPCIFLLLFITSTRCDRAPGMYAGKDDGRSCIALRTAGCRHVL